MKTKIFALAFTLVASSAFAQNGFNPYRLSPIAPNCYMRFNPYHMGNEGEYTPVCAMPVVEGGPRVVYTIVQGSVGMPGREITFLKLVNQTNEVNHAIIEYVIDGKPGTYFQHLYLNPREQYSIGLHADPEMAGEWNFSVTVQFQKSGNIEMTRYAAVDPKTEVDSKPGQEVR